MGRKFDITNKLSFDEPPTIVIKGVEIPLDDTAPTVLKLMAVIGNGADMSVDQINEASRLLFGKDGVKKLEAMHLNFRDYTAVIMECAGLIVGGGDSGEAEGMLAMT